MCVCVNVAADLQCQDPIIYELMQEDDVNPYQLISAQLQVVKSMEENWWVYIDSQWKDMC